MIAFLYVFFIFLFCESWFVFSSKEDWRLKLSLYCFMNNPLELMIGAFHSVVFYRFICVINDGELSKITIFQVIHFIVTVIALGYVAHILLRGPRSFVLERKCPHPGQLKFNNQRPLEVMFFSRFILNISIGFIFVTLIGAFSKIIGQVSIVMIYFYFAIFLVESVPRILKSLPEWYQWAELMLGVIYLLSVFACLPSLSERFSMTLFVLLCDTVHQEYFWLASAISASGHDHEGPSMYPAVQLEKAVINHRQLKNALNQKKSFLKLKILDFAGDKEYHAYFHMFLRSQAVYVIVFNIAEFGEDSLRDLSAKIKSLHPWLESVCSHVPPITPILLVGTHRGNMEQSTMERINDHLKENFWDLFCDELVVNKEYGFIFFLLKTPWVKTMLGSKLFREQSWPL